MSEMKPPRSFADAITALNLLQSNFAAVNAVRRLGPLLPHALRQHEEMFEYVRRIGYSPRDLDKLNIIHVAGTKGKGLTCAFTESILLRYRPLPCAKVGLYSSPHLRLVRERIRIDGSPIDENMFTRYFFEVWDRLSLSKSDKTLWPELQPCESVKPMYFKYLTLVMLHAFLSEGVDTAIVEVGVGGTYDATNLAEKPLVTAISQLAIDHTSLLGNTIEEIAWQKTGIFKRGVPAVVSEQHQYPQAMRIITERAVELECSSLTEVSAKETLPEGIKLGIAGQVQRENAALAVASVAKHLAARGVLLVDLPRNKQLPAQFLEGLAYAQWEGRCQTIVEENIAWHIDGAHTIELIEIATKWFCDEVSALPARPDRIRVLLFNQQSRENASDLLVGLFRHSTVHFDHVVFCTNVTYSLGSYNPELVLLNESQEQVDALVVQKQLAQTWAEQEATTDQRSRKHIFPDIETSVNFFRSKAKECEGVDVFVCGSLHLVGGFLVVQESQKR